MNPLVTSLPSESASAESESPIMVITEEDYVVDWEALYKFHRDRAQCVTIAPRLRLWHQDQARTVKARHLLRKEVVWTWKGHVEAHKSLKLEI